MAPLRAKNASDHFRAATAAIALVASAERFDVLNQALLIKLVDKPPNRSESRSCRDRKHIPTMTVKKEAKRRRCNLACRQCRPPNPRNEVHATVKPNPS